MRRPGQASSLVSEPRTTAPPPASPRVQVPVASGQKASSHTAAVSSGPASRPVGLWGLDRQRGPSGSMAGR